MMSFWRLPLHYLIWHYFLSWRDLFLLYRNLLWFLYHFFSISLLLRTLFSPFKRLAESYPAGLDLGGLVSALLVNTLMRLTGLVMRLGLLAIGSAVIGLAGVLAPALMLVWLLLPLAVLGLFSVGVYLLLA